MSSHKSLNCESSISLNLVCKDSAIFKEAFVEVALVIIKPEAFKHALIIEKLLLNEGFTVLKKRMVHLTPEQASDFYGDYFGKSTFPRKVLALSAGPIVALSVARKDAINRLQILLGPDDVEEARAFYPACLRVQFGTGLAEKNGLYFSESIRRAEKDLGFFFPSMVQYRVLVDKDSDICTKEPKVNIKSQDQKSDGRVLVDKDSDICTKEPKVNIKSQDQNSDGDISCQERLDFLNDMLNPTLKKGLAKLCRERPEDPVLWLARWLLENNPNQPKLRRELIEIPT